MTTTTRKPTAYDGLFLPEVRMSLTGPDGLNQITADGVTVLVACRPHVQVTRADAGAWYFEVAEGDVTPLDWRWTRTAR